MTGQIFYHLELLQCEISDYWDSIDCLFLLVFYQFLFFCLFKLNSLGHHMSHYLFDKLSIQFHSVCLSSF